METRRIVNKKGQIIGTWGVFDEMNNITLVNNLGDLTKDELEKVPKTYIIRWEKWKEQQAQNSYWNNPLHC